MGQTEKVKKIKKFRSIERIINHFIVEKARQEAIDILMSSNHEEFEDFLEKFNDGNLNISCMVIDRIKMRLVKEGKIKFDKTDNFGDEELRK